MRGDSRWRRSNPQTGTQRLNGWPAHYCQYTVWHELYRQEIQNDTTRIIMSQISQKSQVMWCQWWVNRLLSTNHPVYNHPHSLYDYLPVVLLDPDQLDKMDGELDKVVEIVLLIMEVGGSGSYHWCWLILTGWHRLAANIIALRHRESGTTCIHSYIIIIIYAIGSLSTW